MTGFIHSDGRRGRCAAALAEVSEDVDAPVDRRLGGAGVLDAVHARWVATLERDVQATAIWWILPVAEAALVAARPGARVRGVVSDRRSSLLPAPCGHQRLVDASG